MKKAQNTSRKTPKWVSAILLVCAVGVMAGAGQYRKATGPEGSNFKLGFPQSQINEMTSKDNDNTQGHQAHHSGSGQTNELTSKAGILDMADQKWPKSWIQPGVVSFRSGFGNGVKNNSQNEYSVRFELPDFPGYYDMNSENLRSENSPLQRTFQPGQNTNLDITFRIGEQSRNQALVYDGELRAVDSKTGEIIGKTPIVIINSKLDPTGELKGRFQGTGGGGGH
ncbi:MAG TPA: hypothetical protein VJ824_05290 [Bacillota bacterium]|nr:hypothetical protein [Bacillota bacterium]